MNNPPAPAQAGARSDSSHPAGTHLRGRRLIFARVAWILLAGLALGLSVASIPSYFAFLHVVCTGSLETCRNIGQLTPDDLRTLQALGLSLDLFANYQAGLFIVFTVVFATVGLVIFWRKSDDRMALIASLALVMFPASFNYSNLATLPSAWLVPDQFVVFVGSSLMFLFFYLFPDGRFVPRWMRWFWVGAVVFWAVDSFFPSVSSSPFIAVAILSLICSVLGAQIYRYRRVSSPVQRQQTRWVVYGLSIGLGGFLALDLFWIFTPTLSTQNLFGNLLTGTGVFLFFLVIPLSVGVAMLRSHLFDIDRIINRTLVYSLLTAILAVVYFGCIIALQSLVSLFTGHISSASQTAPVLVASTLGIFALAQPLRRRVQALIDRQFYRSRYDAARTLAAFSESLRGELDLDQLSERLMTVVHETMQPSHVSLWLRTPEPSGARNTRVLPRID